MRDSEPTGFDSAKKTAQEYVEHPEKAGHLLKEAAAKADRNRTVLDRVWDDLQTLFRLLKAWHQGCYKSVPWQTVVFALAAVVYFVNPFDLVPDFLPGGGYLDDATVVGFVLKSIQNDLQGFLRWEQTTETSEAT